MKWYSIKLVYQILTEKGKPQVDEQLRLIRADDDDWAKEKAYTLGRLGETIFFNPSNDKLQWKFIGVADLVQVDEIEDGVELYSETKELKNIDRYMENIKKRSARITEVMNAYSGSTSSLALH